MTKGFTSGLSVGFIGRGLSGLGVGQGSRFCVCNLVLTTSSGFVRAAATAPAIEPERERKCVY